MYVNQIVLLTITPSLLIEIAMFLLTVSGIFWKIASNDANTKIKINENTLKILNLEKEFMQMKKEHEKELSEVKERNDHIFETFRKENREEHGKIFDKLEVAVTKLSEVTASFKMHLDASFKSPRDIKDEH